MKKCGFIAVLGRPNAGKSTLLNALLRQNLALVSHKANATRKRMNLIIQHGAAQIIFTDTPGLHKDEKLLNKFMLAEALKAMGECDLAVFLAPITDSTEPYAEFLKECNKPHILLLTKLDSTPQETALAQIKKYEKYADKFLALLPISTKKGFEKSAKTLLDLIAQHLPESPFMFDEQSATDASMREIAKEMIRESLFENLSDELPYQSDVVLKSYKSGASSELIKASIIVEKQSQKAMVIGKGGASIKRIGSAARTKIEAIVERAVYLELSVSVIPNWSKKPEHLKTLGYSLES